MNEAWTSPESGYIPSIPASLPEPVPRPSSPHDRGPTAISKQARPSCDLCRRSKIKCDRLDPCSHCAKVGATCQYSTPSKLSRGRKGGRRKLDSLVLSRLTRLDNLIQQIEAGSVPAPSTAPTVPNDNQRVLLFLNVRFYWQRQLY